MLCCRYCSQWRYVIGSALVALSMLYVIWGWGDRRCSFSVLNNDAEVGNRLLIFAGLLCGACFDKYIFKKVRLKLIEQIRNWVYNDS